MTSSRISLVGGDPFLASIQAFFRLRRMRISDMGFDPFFDHQRHGQGRSAIPPAYGRRCESLHRITKILQLLGERLGIFTFGAADDSLPIFAVWAQLKKRGWFTGLVTDPRAIHLMLSPSHAEVADQYLADLAEAVKEASLRALRRRRENRESTHPFHWAAFVAAGDWR